MKAILALFCSLAVASAESPKVGGEATAEQSAPREMHWIQQQLEFSQPLKIAAFKGPRIELSILQREISFIQVRLLNYDKLTSVTRKNANGYFEKIKVATQTDVRVEKKNPMKNPLGKSDLYLIYQDPESGITVYFADEIAPANHDAIVLLLPK